MVHPPTPPSLASRILCAFACAGTIALLAAVAPIASVLAGADLSPQTLRRLFTVTGFFCLLAAGAGFWLGPSRVLHHLENESQGRLWVSILMALGVTALVRLLWRFAG